MDIVFFTLFRTDNPYSSISLSMAKELAKNHRVFYVNHPYTLKDCWNERHDPIVKKRLSKMLLGQTGYESVASIPTNFVAAQPPATLPIGVLPKGVIFEFFQKINNGIVLKSIRKLLKDNEIQDFIFINCYDPYYAGVLPKSFGARLNIYHCIDDIRENPYSAKHAADLEDGWIQQADVTFVTSTNLFSLKKPLTNRLETYFNAADVAVFRQVLEKKYDRPKELDGRTGGVIGFVGNLDELRIDYPLLKKVAEAHPDKTLLLVGPINSPEPKQIGLDKMTNVVFAGSRKLEDLPQYVQYMDVVMIPFLLNTLTASIYPLKINEYLAAGKPVISTKFSNDIQSFSDVIYLADNHENFSKLVEKAMLENDQTRTNARVEVANSNTWTARIAQLWEIVEKYAPAKILKKATV
jgi:teichuronic acid biosynthesis glycosyltransferase TuaH